MFVGGYCLFCNKCGHNLDTCANGGLRHFIYELEQPLLRCMTYNQLYRVLCGYDTYKLQILSKRIRASVGLPRLLLLYSLYRYYKNNIVLEDGGTEYSEEEGGGGGGNTEETRHAVETVQ